MPDISQIIEPEVARIMTEHGVEISAPAGTKLFEPGGECARFLVVTGGRVRVQMLAECGREIVLYRVFPGETCVLTTSCLMSHTDYRAEGVAETALSAQVLQAGDFRRLMNSSEDFRNFVFANYGKRFASLIELIEEVLFKRIDIRLARHLLKASGDSGCVVQTHQELAVELGTAREVISRQLKEFERRGWVSLSRGKVALERCDKLRELAVSQ